MTFLVSPGVKVNEFDITTIIPAVAVTSAAIGGVFLWGPLNQRILVSSETNLVQQFLGPTNFNPETWFSAANYLGYGNSLYVSRAGSVTGNTVTVTAGNSTVNAITTNSAVIAFTSTANLNIDVGSQLFYSSNSLTQFTQANATVLSINSTAVVMNCPAIANVATESLTFRDPIIFSAVAQEFTTPTINWAGQTVANNLSYITKQGTFDSTVLYIAKYPGSSGNSIAVAVCDSYNQFQSNVTVIGSNTYVNAAASSITASPGNNQVVFTVGCSNTANVTVSGGNVYTFTTSLQQQFVNNDLIQVGNSQIGYQYLQITNVGAISNTSNSTYFGSSQFTLTCNTNFRLAANIVMTSANRYWEYYNVTKVAPTQSPYQLNFGNTSANDELHIVVTDNNGVFTGVPGTVLEVYTNLSRATDSLNADGSTNYYATVINQKSQYIWFANDRSLAPSNTSPYLISSTATAPLNAVMYGGADGPNETNIPLAQLTFAYDQFASAADVDVGLIICGKARGSGIDNYTDLAEYIIQNICQQRKDCVAFVSPDISDVVNQYGNQATNIVQFRNYLPSTSYAVMDTGYKYQYDRYNNIYRWIPLNGDIAGLCTRTDTTNDPWWSPAGFNRGQINNVVVLAYNPGQTDRDLLYTNGVNPVVTFPGQGTILYGDKTLLSRPSAFDRINVRRLFIVLEKAIATASEYLLFEFNDGFTQATFKNMVNPYLRQIQGQRGITDFLVVCDATNNTPTVVDANQFVGDIYIKPARSINFINLNFVAVPTGVAFSETIGQFGQL